MCEYVHLYICVYVCMYVCEYMNVSNTLRDPLWAFGRAAGKRAGGGQAGGRRAAGTGKQATSAGGRHG